MRNTREKQRKVAAKKTPPPAQKAIAKTPKPKMTRPVPKGLTGKKLEEWLQEDNDVEKSGMSFKQYRKLYPKKRGRRVKHELESDKRAARLTYYKTYNGKRTGERDRSGRFKYRQPEP